MSSALTITAYSPHSLLEAPFSCCLGSLPELFRPAQGHFGVSNRALAARLGSAVPLAAAGHGARNSRTAGSDPCLARAVPAPTPQTFLRAVFLAVQASPLSPAPVGRSPRCRAARPGRCRAFWSAICWHRIPVSRARTPPCQESDGCWGERQKCAHPELLCPGVRTELSQSSVMHGCLPVFLIPKSKAARRHWGLHFS